MHPILLKMTDHIVPMFGIGYCLIFFMGGLPEGIKSTLSSSKAPLLSPPLSNGRYE